MKIFLAVDGSECSSVSNAVVSHADCSVEIVRCRQASQSGS